jgi:hypothetical protein
LTEVNVIKPKRTKRKIEIDLTGPEGNAYALLGYASNFCKQIGRDFRPIQTEMMAGDYEHLLKVFDREFGDFVIMYR